jgi:hypothetical protein
MSKVSDRSVIVAGISSGFTSRGSIASSAGRCRPSTAEVRAATT